MFNIGDEVYYTVYADLYEYDNNSPSIPSKITKGEVEGINITKIGVKYKIRYGEGDYHYDNVYNEHVYPNEETAIKACIDAYKEFIVSTIDVVTLIEKE